MVFIGEEGEGFDEGSDEGSDEDSDEGSDEDSDEGSDEDSDEGSDEDVKDTEVSEGADQRAGCRMASEIHVVGDSVEHLFQHTARPL